MSTVCLIENPKPNSRGHDPAGSCNAAGSIFQATPKDEKDFCCKKINFGGIVLVEVTKVILCSLKNEDSIPSVVGYFYTEKTPGLHITVACYPEKLSGN